MRIIDLSHYLESDMPLYPDTAAPRFEETAAIQTDGFREKRISLCVHTGTHVDAPAHIIAGAKTLDQFSADTFCGPVILLDCTAAGRSIIDYSYLRSFEKSIRQSEFLILRTGWSRYWGNERYFSGFSVFSLFP